MLKNYQALNLEEKATFEEVKSAYRNLSMKYHPDLNGDTEENREKFYIITDAYNAIKKDIKKICKLLSLDDNESMEEVTICYKKQMEEFQFRVKMGNAGAHEDMVKLKQAYNFYISSLKTSNESW